MKLKLKVIISVVILSSFSLPSQGLPFQDYGLASVAEFEEPAAELRRDKRTLTTICVEIKPSTPYEEPYFMCKGTDSPKYSKDSSGTSDSYSPGEPSYKPSKPPTSYVSGKSDSYHSGVNTNNDYHVLSKPEYHAQYSKYERPSSPSTYDSPKKYSSPPPSKQSFEKNPYNAHVIHHSEAYSDYERPSKASSHASAKPSSYADQHEHQDDYSKSHQAQKVTFEKTATQPAYSSKPHAYNHENPSTYDHRHQPAAYSKPSSYESHTSPSGGYAKPSNSYEPTEYSKPSSYEHSSTPDASPSYGNSHSETSYGGVSDGHSYSAPPEMKVLYSKPASYPSKQISYEHADNSQYGQQKPSYSEQPSSKPYSKPTQDYGKPSAPTYPSHEQQSDYAHQPQNYRMMPQELLQPTWEPQPQQLQYDGFGYRSYGARPMENQNLETPRVMNYDSQLNTGLMETPLRFDLLDANQDGPTLQSPYPHQSYPPSTHHVHQGASYSSVAPSYVPTVHYAPASPSYPVAAYPSAAPSYAPVPPPPPSFAPLPVPSPTYFPAAPPYSPAMPSSQQPSVPACRQNYMYSFQPVIMPVPCYSMSAGYTSASYVQPLGAPPNQQTLQDHSSSRAENNSEENTKTVSKDNSGSQESLESDKKSDSGLETSQTNVMKSENLKEPSDIAEEKHQQIAEKNSQDLVVPSAEKSIITKEDQVAKTAAPAAPQKIPEGPNTKEAFNAMMKMARIAAQLNKDDVANKGSGPTEQLGAGGSAIVQGNGKPSEPLPQFSRTN